MKRLNQLNMQFAAPASTDSGPAKLIVDGKTYTELIDHQPSRVIKQDYFNKQGWGFSDSGFTYLKESNSVKIKGTRYMYGNQVLPNLLPFFEKALKIDARYSDFPQADIQVPPPMLNHAFLEELGEKDFSRRSFEKWERIMHSHGATLEEINAIRYTTLKRYADVVVYPNSTEHCEKLVKLAMKHNVCLVPYGGGTNVTKALQLPTTEKRMIVSVDMQRMNAVKWVDKENRTACIQAGVMGTELERSLKAFGVVLGHEPDSHEFSTLGGWISTRASGMKKNTYGNIEDIVVNITIVTPKGTYQKNALWPRVSNGPDLNHLIMGSEGNFGIITEAVLRVRPIPEAKIYDSILFYDFEQGIKFMYEVSSLRSYPASLRLIDN